MAGAYPSKADISRALQAAQSLGLSIARYEITSRGQIRVFLGRSDSDGQDAFEEWQARRRAKSLNLT